MEVYLRTIISPNSKSETTKNTRVGYLSSLYRKLGSTTSDLSFLNNIHEVMKIVEDSTSTATIKTRLFHIIEAAKHEKAKSVDPGSISYYVKQADKIMKKFNAESGNNVMNDKQAESYISIDDANEKLEQHINNVLKDYNIQMLRKLSVADFDRLSQMGPRKNIYTFAKDLQECLMLALYVWQVAVRNDWANLTITHRIIIPNTGNWLQVKKDKSMVLILNDYKTDAQYGKQRINVDPRLAKLIGIWIDLLERLLDRKVIHPIYYTINAKGKIDWVENKQSFNRQFMRIAEKILGKRATINTFRHAHEEKIQSSEEYKNMTISQKTKEHMKLLHGYTQGQKYNLLKQG
jgi:hypothetical protein